MNLEQCVDARHILVYLLSSKLTDAEIASLIDITRQGINKIKNGFRRRMKSKFTLSNNFQQISSELETESF